MKTVYILFMIWGGDVRASSKAIQTQEFMSLKSCERAAVKVKEIRNIKTFCIKDDKNA